MSAAAPVLFPVGFTLGAQWWDDTVTRPGFAVRLGDDLVTLTAAEYDIWWQARFHPTAAGLLAWAAGDGVDAAAEALGALRGVGLVAEVAPVGAACFAAHHRVLPTGVGAGLISARADVTCQVWSAATDPLIELDRPTYKCWAFSDGARAIADVVALVQPSTGLSHDALLHRVVLALPAMVGAGAAVVDRLPV